jgi:hypothetical protein
MEPLAFARRVVTWRWTPCVAPVMGSVLIALLTLLVVPEEIGGSGAGTGSRALRGKGDKAPDSGSDDTGSGTNPDGITPARHSGVGNGRPRPAADAIQGFFHQAQELPITPVDPTLQPEPPAPPPPAPTATVFTLPEPAVAATPPLVLEPGTLPPPDGSPPPLGPGALPPGATAPVTP